MLVQLVTGLFMVMYFFFIGYTIYFALIGSPKPNQEPLGKLILYHGRLWIVLMIVVSVMTLSFIFASVLLKNLQPFIGG
jgi:hypothetical protein